VIGKLTTKEQDRIMHPSSRLWSGSCRRLSCWIRDCGRHFPVRTCSYHCLRCIRSRSSIRSSLRDIDRRCYGVNLEVSTSHLKYNSADLKVKDGNTCSTYLVVSQSSQSSLVSLLFRKTTRRCVKWMRIDVLIGSEGLLSPLDYVCFASV